ncbi:unnamed protein product [Amoebophrya sp. A25]|nr:unnamed protein product [Amoebophrya sp. A25]|eukprot:GSA25T00014401001.1
MPLWRKKDDQKGAEQGKAGAFVAPAPTTVESGNAPANKGGRGKGKSQRGGANNRKRKKGEQTQSGKTGSTEQEGDARAGKTNGKATASVRSSTSASIPPRMPTLLETNDLDDRPVSCSNTNTSISSNKKNSSSQRSKPLGLLEQAMLEDEILLAETAAMRRASAELTIEGSDSHVIEDESGNVMLPKEAANWPISEGGSAWRSVRNTFVVRAESKAKAGKPKAWSQKGGAKGKYENKNSAASSGRSSGNNGGAYTSRKPGGKGTQGGSATTPSNLHDSLDIPGKMRGKFVRTQFEYYPAGAAPCSLSSSDDGDATSVKPTHEDEDAGKTRTRLLDDEDEQDRTSTASCKPEDEQEAGKTKDVSACGINPEPGVTSSACALLVDIEAKMQQADHDKREKGTETRQISCKTFVSQPSEQGTVVAVTSSTRHLSATRKVDQLQKKTEARAALSTRHDGWIPSAESPQVDMSICVIPEESEEDGSPQDSEAATSEQEALKSPLLPASEVLVVKEVAEEMDTPKKKNVKALTPTAPSDTKFAYNRRAPSAMDFKFMADAIIGTQAPPAVQPATAPGGKSMEGMAATADAPVTAQKKGCEKKVATEDDFRAFFGDSDSDDESPMTPRTTVPNSALLSESSGTRSSLLTSGSSVSVPRLSVCASASKATPANSASKWSAWSPITPKEDQDTTWNDTPMLINTPLTGMNGGASTNSLLSGDLFQTTEEEAVVNDEIHTTTSSTEVKNNSAPASGDVAGGPVIDDVAAQLHTPALDGSDSPCSVRTYNAATGVEDIKLKQAVTEQDVASSWNEVKSPTTVAVTEVENNQTEEETASDEVPQPPSIDAADDIDEVTSEEQGGGVASDLTYNEDGDKVKRALSNVEEVKTQFNVNAPVFAPTGMTFEAYQSAVDAATDYCPNGLPHMIEGTATFPPSGSADDFNMLLNGGALALSNARLYLMPSAENTGTSGVPSLFGGAPAAQQGYNVDSTSTFLRLQVEQTLVDQQLLNSLEAAPQSSTSASNKVNNMLTTAANGMFASDAFALTRAAFNLDAFSDSGDSDSDLEAQGYTRFEVIRRPVAKSADSSNDGDAENINNIESSTSTIKNSNDLLEQKNDTPNKNDVNITTADENPEVHIQKTSDAQQTSAHIRMTPNKADSHHHINEASTRQLSNTPPSSRTEQLSAEQSSSEPVSTISDRCVSRNASLASAYWDAILSESESASESRSAVRKLCEYYADDNDIDALVADYLALPTETAAEMVAQFLCLGAGDSQKAVMVVKTMRALVRERVLRWDPDISDALHFFKSTYFEQFQLDNPKVLDFVAELQELGAIEEQLLNPRASNIVVVPMREQDSLSLSQSPSKSEPDAVVAETESQAENTMSRIGSHESVCAVLSAAAEKKRYTRCELLIFRIPLLETRAAAAWDVRTYADLQKETGTETSTRRADNHAAGGGGRGRGGKHWSEPPVKRSEVAKIMKPSATSWVRTQASHGAEMSKEDAQLAWERKLMSLLNKITFEKFEPVLTQIMELLQKLPKMEIPTVGIPKLISMLFQIATTQHHFVSLYTQLCQRIQAWLEQSGLDKKGKEGSFKRHLLNQCQTSFESYLSPDLNFKDLTGEDLFEAQVKFKTKMLGNIKLVGELIRAKMIASRIAICILQDLVENGRSEGPAANANLETLAAFLETVGPILDKPDWAHWNHFDQALEIVAGLSQTKAVPARIRCLLQDILDLRDSDWFNTKKGKVREKATTLKEVNHAAATDTSSNKTKTRSPHGKVKRGSCSSIWAANKDQECARNDPQKELEGLLHSAFERVETEAKTSLRRATECLPSLAQCFAAMYKRLTPSESGAIDLVAHLLQKIMKYEQRSMRELFYRFLCKLCLAGIFSKRKSHDELVNRAMDRAGFVDDALAKIEEEFYPILDECFYNYVETSGAAENGGGN